MGSTLERNVMPRTTEVSAPFVAAARSGTGALAMPRWFAGKAWGLFLMALYPVLAVAPLLAFASLNGISDHMRGAEVGVDCAVVGLTILALQFVVTARLPWVEGPFGLDVLLVFHRAMALVAVGLLCAHPILMLREEGWALLVGRHARWYFWIGVLAFAVLLAQLILGLGRRVIRLPYERWRRVHHTMALTILGLGFVHSTAAGDDMQGAGLLVWGVVLATALGFWLYAHVLRPRLLRRRAFRVLETRREGPQVWTLTLAPEDGHPFRFLPGQFQFLRLHDSGVAPEEHPFTIASSAARQDRISLTIKESGDFTAGIGRVRPGDRASVHGPFGRFSHALHADERDLVFVAGGIGITPLLSMLRSMRDSAEPRRVLLVYACRQAADLLFTPELEAMAIARRPQLTVVPVLSKPLGSWSGETGLLDAGRLARLCGGIEHKAFYLCGPPPMMAGLILGLRRLGVSPRRIHADHFSL
jgi:predicted ferric reductase